MLLTFLCAFSAVTQAPAADPGLRPWPDYRTIMWVGDSASKKPEKLALFHQRLREMGINTSMVYGTAKPSVPLQNHFPYYVENIVNTGLCLKFNSHVTDWDKFVTQWAATGRPESALARDYCLDDPNWLDRAKNQMREAANLNRAQNPLAYDIRDELSTTLSANPFDYDFNPIALREFRAWLQTRYADLAALNREWETVFKTWDEVKPFTTDQIKNRMASGEALPRGKPDWQKLQALKFDPATARDEPTRWNFSPWAAFRSYMDHSLSRALGQLRDAAHELDPATPVGIEGTQMPSAFGGYDLYELSKVLDWVEPYDIGNAREIFGSFMPGKPIVTTVFESDTNHARRRLWHLLLEGDRGCIVWWSEDCIDWNSDDYRLTSKAQALAPVLKEMTGDVARLFLHAEPEYDQIYLHYSQPSIQVDWLLESTVDGSTWLRRFSSYEADHNIMARTRDGWLKLFQDLGYNPRFISSEQLIATAIPRERPAVLVLPTCWALSDAEADAIKTFANPSQSNRIVFSDVTPGVFDGHGKLRKADSAMDLFALTNAAGARVGRGGIIRLGWDDIKVANYAAARLAKVLEQKLLSWTAQQMAFMPPPISLTEGNRVRIHRYRAGRNRLVAFERNVDYHMSEQLKQAGGNENLEAPIEVVAKLPQAAHIYDLQSKQYLGHTDTLRFTLDLWRPSLFVLTGEKLRSAALDEQAIFGE